MVGDTAILCRQGALHKYALFGNIVLEYALYTRRFRQVLPFPKGSGARGAPLGCPDHLRPA